ncbi:response regulator transcription factor [Patulibacter sp. S7RM1-6]
MAPSPIELVVVDDHMIVRDGVRAMADREPDLRFAGGAATTVEAVDLVERMRPHVAFVDVRLGDESGVELCATLTGRFPDTAVLVFSGFHSGELLTQAIRAGASGYALKETDTTRLPEIVRELHRTGTYFDPRVSGDLLVGMVTGGRGAPAAAPLSDRDRRIIALIAQGASNYDIATELHMSSHTVKFHVTNLLRRFDVSRRAQLVKVAMERQLL